MYAYTTIAPLVSPSHHCMVMIPALVSIGTMLYCQGNMYRTASSCSFPLNLESKQSEQYFDTFCFERNIRAILSDKFRGFEMKACDTEYCIFSLSGTSDCINITASISKGTEEQLWPPQFPGATSLQMSSNTTSYCNIKHF